MTKISIEKEFLVGLIIISSIIGILVGGFLFSFRPPQDCPFNVENGIFTPDEACVTFFNCEHGYGTIGQLHCRCDESWQVFGITNISDMIGCKNGD